MTDRRARAALLALPALLLAGCASGSLTGAGTVGSGSGAASVGTSSGGSASGSASGGSAGTSGGTSGGSGETLAAQLHEGIAKVQTAHFALKVSAAGQDLDGSGDEKLVNGKLTAMRLSENLPGGGGSLSLVLVDGKTYVKLPASLNKTGKPWLLATTSSSNAVVRQLAQSLSSTLSSASVGSVGAFVDAARSIKTVGRETIGGVPATHLAIVVDVKKLAKSVPNGDALTQAGLDTLPVDMWLDDEHRPVQISEDFQVSGQKVVTLVNLNHYNAPVTITAPPAAQVGR